MAFSGQPANAKRVRFTGESDYGDKMILKALSFRRRGRRQKISMTISLWFAPLGDDGDSCDGKPWNFAHPDFTTASSGFVSPHGYQKFAPFRGGSGNCHDLVIRASFIEQVFLLKKQHSQLEILGISFPFSRVRVRACARQEFFKKNSSSLTFLQLSGCLSVY